MRRRTAILVLALLGLTVLATLPGWMPTRRGPEVGQAAATPTGAGVVDALATLPLAFEPNRGQAADGADFVARGPGFRLTLGPVEAAIDLRANTDHANTDLANTDLANTEQARSDLRLRLVGSNPEASPTAADPLPTRTNYLVGDDPAGWLTGVPSFGRVTYDDVYPGIDLMYFGNQRRLEHDFVVAPGADPAVVAFEVAGADRLSVDGLSVDRAGDLVVTGSAGETVARLARPVLYQDVDGRRRPVDGAFVLRGDSRVGFSVGSYDARLPLVIDPVLVTSTYLGGSGLDTAAAVDVDGAGNVYVAGSTESTDFPMTKPFQATLNKDGSAGKSDAFVAKYNPDGNTMLFATYLGGTARDAASGVAISGDGSVFVAGVTESPDFPKTTPVAQENYAGGTSDAFVAKLNPAGDALTYATFLGGKEMDAARGIAVVSSGEAILTGSTNSIEFPAVNPLQASPPRPEDVDAFVTKLTPAGNAFAYSTRLGGSNDDHGLDIATDPGGNAYITGDTRSPGFPTARPLQAGAGGTASGVGGSFADAFVSKLDPAGTNLVYSTFLGGSDTDQGTGIAVDGDGAAYVTGGTSSPNFPTASPLQGRKDADTDAFVSKINPAGAALVYSTYLGGGGADNGTTIAADRAGNATVAGATASSNFPTARPVQGVKGGGVTDAFVATFGPAGTSLVTSTYLGGRDDDQAAGIALAGGTPIVVGSTSSSDFPIAKPLQPARSGTSADAFVTRMSPTEGDAAAPATTAAGSSGTHERRVRILVATTAGLFLIAVLQTAYLRRRTAAEARGDGEPMASMPTTEPTQWGGGVRVLDDDPGDSVFADAGKLPGDDDGVDTIPPPTRPMYSPPSRAPAAVPAPTSPPTAGPPMAGPHSVPPAPPGPSTLAVPDLLEEWAGTGAAAVTPPLPRAPLEDLSFWDLFPEDLPPSSRPADVDDEWAIDNTGDVLIGPPPAPPGPDRPVPGSPPWDDDILLTDLLAGDLAPRPATSETTSSRPETVDEGLVRNGAESPAGVDDPDELADDTQAQAYAPDRGDDHEADALSTGHDKANDHDETAHDDHDETAHGDGDADNRDGDSDGDGGDGADDGDGLGEGAAAATGGGGRSGTSGQTRRRPRNRRSGSRKRPTSG